MVVKSEVTNHERVKAIRRQGWDELTTSLRAFQEVVIWPAPSLTTQRFDVCMNIFRICG